MSQEVRQGECLEVLRGMDDASIDAVVCDPPYGLSAEPDAAEVLRHWIAGDDYEHRGSGFMGKSWDSFVPGPSVWKECYRVLKPGGHLLAFAGSRTFDLMGMSVRLAGFDMRDFVAWIYGSGFPKSLDVSKAIDAAAGATREVVGHKDGNLLAVAPGQGEDRSATQLEVTAPATEAAAEWEGWGTALKPAHEPIVVARKPFSGTVAANVQKHGTGALNIDACRIDTRTEPQVQGGYSGDGAVPVAGAREGGKVYDEGRWPPNLLVTPEAVIDLDAQTGERPPRAARVGEKGGNGGGLGAFAGSTAGAVGAWPEDPGGGASRFYYCAKSSKLERNVGLDGFDVKDKAQLERAASEVEDEDLDDVSARFRSKMPNVHPTVKPVNVMRWLCRLVAPEGALVLDPFTGSGTTGCAAALEGLRFIGIEREPEYVAIAQARIRWWAEHAGREAEEVLALAAASNRASKKHEDSGQLGFEL